MQKDNRVNKKKTSYPHAYNVEFKREAVRRVIVEGQPQFQVASDLEISKSSLSKWVIAARSDVGASSFIGISEEDELRSLRKEVKQLRMERDFLKKATAFFAKDQA